MWAQIIVPGDVYYRSGPITKLPTEILDAILVKMRVNDQICLALTSKSLAQRIGSSRKLACNSRKITDRYEAWRFQWLSTDTDPAGSLTRKQYDMTHARRCIKSSRSDLKARLDLRRASTTHSNVETVASGRNNNVWVGRLRSRPR